MPEKGEMKRLTTGVALVLIMLVPANGWCWYGYVVKVRDGDSLRVRKGGKDYEIRLYGIDAPEYGQRFGDRARQFTKARTYKKTVVVEPMDIDRYGRIVAVVRSQGRIVNKELVDNGLAWFYERYCRDKQLCDPMEKSERKAREARRGLWKDESPVPPWEWKKQVREKGSPTRFHREYRLPYWR